MMDRILSALFLAMPMASVLFGAGVFDIDFSQPAPPPDAWIKLGGKNPIGEVLGVNGLSWTRNGQAWLPVMGEFHYSRYPASEWERELLKMKAGGISVVSTYALWVNHENPKGIWKWDGDEDLRRFVLLCRRHGLYFWLRIGPYCNAEARNGGFPDFIAKMPGKRTDDPAYLAEVDRWYAQIGEQVRDQMFHAGGPVIGIQLENEFASGNPDHIETLRQMAIKHGLIAPFYTVTANTRFRWKEGTIIPLQGAYPYRGWGPLGFPTQDFMYRSEAWGAMFNEYGAYYDLTRFPVGFCEMGAGCWYAYDNRFVVPARDSEALLQDTLGRGSSLVGYYMFHGGTQRAGVEMSGHPLSYDFQAPLGEFGLVRESYHALKRLHHFINDYATFLADSPVIRPVAHPENPKDTKTLRYVARARNGAGFIFLNNIQAWVDMQDQKDVQLRVSLPDAKSLTFPEKPFTLQRGTYAIFPCNLDLNGSHLAYATAQPLARFESGRISCFIFFAVPGIDPEFAFEPSAKRIFRPLPGLDSAFAVAGRNGARNVFVTLTAGQAAQSWRFKTDGQDRLFLSSANLVCAGDILTLYAATNRMRLDLFPGRNGSWDRREFNAPPVSFTPEIQHLSPNEWEFRVEKLPEALWDVQVAIKFLGSAATLFVDGKKYTDFWYNGTAWNIGLNRFFRPDSGPHIFRIKVTPWEDKIKGVPAALTPQTDDERKGMIQSIDFIPVFQSLVSELEH